MAPPCVHRLAQHCGATKHYFANSRGDSTSLAPSIGAGADPASQTPFVAALTPRSAEILPPRKGFISGNSASFKSIAKHNYVL